MERPSSGLATPGISGAAGGRISTETASGTTAITSSSARCCRPAAPRRKGEPMGSTARAFVAVGLSLVGGSQSAVPRRRTITLVDTTAETSTSAAVVWNTNVASDSLLQYSTTHPIPAGAPRVYVPTPVTVHDIQLEGLTPGTLHYFRVTSCAKHGCATATGTFDTYPSCPDSVSPVPGSWQRMVSP